MREGLRGLERARVNQLLSSREGCSLHRGPSKRAGPHRCEPTVGSMQEGLLSPP